jgi:hypothetical protein
LGCRRLGRIQPVLLLGHRYATSAALNSRGSPDRLRSSSRRLPLLGLAAPMGQLAPESFKLARLTTIFALIHARATPSLLVEPRPRFQPRRGSSF